MTSHNAYDEHGPDEHAEPNTKPLGVRVPRDQFAYVERLRINNDVDRSRQVRRMIKFCELNMPDGWLPPVEE